jgi:Caspase domain
VRCASICVGIIAYEDRHYRESDKRLLHAVEDAEAFHRYTSTAFDEKDSRHYLLTDSSANFSGINRTFLKLKEEGHFEFLIFYLSGHGELLEEDTAAGGWFCLADAVPGAPSLNRSAIDRLLQMVEVDRVLLVMDCCFAEATISGSEFFARLDRCITRVFVVSARANQRSWEDDGLGRSIFSDVLLRALSTESDIADAKGQIDLEGRLLPLLREQVPLVTASRKGGAEQEPVVGGVSVSQTLLPMVTTRSLGRQLTVAETVGRRVRKSLGLIAVTLILSLFALELTIFHVVAIGSGEIHVRPGLPATYGLLPFHLGQEVDSGLRLDDLDQRDEDVFNRLSQGDLWGFATRQDDRGMKQWLSEIEGGLSVAKKKSIAVFAVGTASIFDPSEQPPPWVEAGFLARLKARPIDQVAREIYPPRDEVDVSCGEQAGLKIDETILSADPEVFEKEIAWRAMTAPKDPQGRADALANMLRLAAYRAFHQNDADVRSREFQAFVRAVRRLTKFSDDVPSVRAYTLGTLAPATVGWCSMYSKFALAALNSGGPDQEATEAPFWNTFVEAYRDGDPALLSPEQDLARIALEELARLAPISERTMKELDAIVRHPGADVARTTPAVSLLSALAPLQALPNATTDAMADAMGARNSDEFSALAAFGLLAANSRHLDPESLAKVVDWADDHLQADRTISVFHEALGYLARPGFFPKTYESLLVSRLSPASRFEPTATNYQGETLINATSDQAVVALGRAALVIEQPASVLERLANVVAARPTMRDRAVVVEGISRWRYDGEIDLPQAILDRLRAKRIDAIGRSLEVELASTRLAKLSHPSQEQTMEQLVSAWKMESEPELRIAIAQVIGEAATADYRQR